MAPSQIGLVLHPSRDVDDAVQAIGDWASRHGVAVGQVPIPGQRRRMGDPVDAAACDLLIAVGGDGTMLAALHAGAPASRPVLGIAAGSIGVLTSVHVDDISSALEHVAEGNWTPRSLPGLDVRAATGEIEVAINDFAVIRDGTGQVITAITVDDDLYARTAGDGLVVATPLGSSAYTMAAGGPLRGRRPGAGDRGGRSDGDHAPRLRDDGHAGRPGAEARRPAPEGPDSRRSPHLGPRQARSAVRPLAATSSLRAR